MRRCRSSSSNRSGNSPSAGPPNGGRRRTSPPWEPTMTDDSSAGAVTAADDGRTADTGSVARRLEPILLIVEEPQSLVSLAAAVGAPVAAVRPATEALVDDYVGRSAGPRRGYDRPEVGGGGRAYA